MNIAAMTTTETLEVRLDRRLVVIVRLARCMSVSVFTTVLSLGVLMVLTTAYSWSATVANVAATAVGTVPSYVLNRRWVWGRRDSSDPWREVVPFWVLSFSGMVLSTAAVGVTDAWATSVGLSDGVRTVAILVANVSAFAGLWVIQFLVLDRLLFGRTEASSPAEP